MGRHPSILYHVKFLGDDRQADGYGSDFLEFCGHEILLLRHDQSVRTHAVHIYTTGEEEQGL